MGTVTYLMRADRDGWAVLVDGAQVGVLLSTPAIVYRHNRKYGTQRVASRTRKLWNIVGEPPLDFGTRAEATQYLLRTLALRERQAMAADGAAKRGDADPA